MQIKLPKLKKVNLDRPKKKKILLLSDSIQFKSGIATQSRELIYGTAEHFDWVQLGAALHHPDHGQIHDVSDEVNQIVGIDHASVKVYCHTGYGTPEILREILRVEKPDALMIFTDPRHWMWFFPMEHEIRVHWKIPVIYNSIWDNWPLPIWNIGYYESCDLLFGISKQTHLIHKEVLKYGDVEFVDLDQNESLKSGKILTTYLPHGINPKLFYPIGEDDLDYVKFRDDFKQKHDVDFVILFNNRNIRRKNPADVILAFKTFCDRLSPEQAKRCALLMKTSILDENGTDLMAVRKAVCPDYKVIFNQDIVPEQILNYYYNLCDLTINISSNEGFGLSQIESLMAGTIVLSTVSGGLQDSMRFEDNDGKWFVPTIDIPSNHAKTYLTHGKWCYPIFPTSRSLQGSIPTPYIFDDRVDFKEVGDTIFEIYNTEKHIRNENGLLGHKWVLSTESGFSSDIMCKKFIKTVDLLLNTWVPKQKYELLKVNLAKKITNIGIIV